ncbi:hypothetical protein SCUCBS95973_002392 [Sporothrix curviconia]|uniref:Siderochrome-iron transporter n=1 Tax=Sporothrix curviconia TaxID=1260050 RepID=A0ABP0B6Q2_9PEZI
MEDKAPATVVAAAIATDNTVDTINNAEASPKLSLEQQNEKEVIQNPDKITQDAQLGVQKAEAVALVWSKKTAYAVYVWVWLLFFVVSLQAAISNNIIYYAYADFASAPQIAQSYILAAVISGVLQLPIAKTLNLWGRAEGFLVFVAVYTLGLVVMAACTGPASYAAGYTIYYVGYTAVNFILSIFVADTSGLHNRAFAFALTGAPTICTAFVGPLAAQAFVTHVSWQWAYGAFAVIIPATCAPLAVVLKVFQKRAEAQGIFVRRPTASAQQRTLWRSIVHYLVAFDIVGALLLMAAFVLVLLPFSLQSYGLSHGYGSATFIAMLVVGVLLFPVFAAWEVYGLPQTPGAAPFLRWQLFRNRTVVGACAVSAILFFNFYTWDQYFYYYVQVVYDLDITRTGYMAQINGVGSTVWGVVFGVWIRKTRHFKYVCLFFGTPLLLLGAALMVYFRGAGSAIGWLVMCQIFIAFGTATLIVGDEMAVMAAADREGVPLVIALLGLFASIGGALGNAVAAAVYASVFPRALLDKLPPETQADYLDIYIGGSATQLLYPVGSATRTVIDYAWQEAQKYECITAAAIVVLAFPAIALWKNYSVDRKQVKGTVL